MEARADTEVTAAELMCLKKGLFSAILGLFLQTKGGFEDQKVGRIHNNGACARHL